MSDGELQAGQVWEALAAMKHHRLDRVGIYVDVNGQQCDGAVEDVMSLSPLAARLRAFGAAVHEVSAHDVQALAEPARSAGEPLTEAGAPLIILAHSDPCRGLPLLAARRPKLHYVRFRDPDERAANAAALARMATPPPEER